ncbi:MAG: glycosyltransferase family 4 protein [Syntrophales bacterium]
MVAYSNYDSDNRVRRYAETLVRRGDAVDVISLRWGDQRDSDRINGVRVFRIQSREMNEKRKISYFYRVMKFLVKSAVYLSRQHLREPYDLIHVHSVPDFEVFAALIPKLKGAKVILDIHDLVPELYCSKFGKDHGSLIYEALALLEKYSASFADHVIASNHIWYKRLLDRSVTKSNSTVILNYPDSSVFYRRTNHRDDGKPLMIYPGTLNWHQGLDVAIKAFDKIREKVPEAEFHIYGDGPSKLALASLIRELGLEGRVLLNGTQPLDKMANIMSRADIGIVPKRNNSFGGEAFSTKILEFMSLGIPVIVSRTKIDNYYFNDCVVKFFRPEDEADLAEKMVALIKDRQERERLVANASRFLEDYAWENKQHLYLDLVDRLVHGRPLARTGKKYNQDSKVKPSSRCV